METQRELSKRLQLLKIRNDLLRYKCMTDLYYLATEVLGYADLSPVIHKPLCKVIESVNQTVISQSSPDIPYFKAKKLFDQVQQALYPPNISPLESSPLNEVQSSSSSVQLSNPPELESGGTGGGMVGVQPTPKIFKISAPIIKINESEYDEYLTDYGSLERLFLMFRGSFKTTLVSIAHTIQLMLVNPNIRDRKSTRLNSSHIQKSRMPSSA